MTQSSPALPEDILSLIIRTHFDHCSDKNWLNCCSSLRLVNSFFNDTILHEAFIVRLPAKRIIYVSYRRHFLPLIALRHLQGALFKGSNLQLPDDLSKRFLASASEAIHSFHVILPDRALQKTEARRCLPCGEDRRTLPVTMSTSLSNRNPAFNDKRTVLLCSAIVRYCSPETVIRALLPPFQSYTSEPLTESIAGLGPAFWLLVAACHAGDIDLAQKTLPQALENAGGSKTLSLAHPAFVHCLFVAVWEDQPDVFQFLLSIGIDPNVKCRDDIDLLLADVVRSGRSDSLSMLLSSPHKLWNIHECENEVVVVAAKLEDATARNIMVDGLLANGLYHGEAAGRQEVLSWALWYSDLLLAEKMLVENPKAAIYSIATYRRVVKMLERGRESNVKLIRLVVKHSHKFATPPIDDLPSLQQAEARALSLCRYLADFVELLDFLPAVPPLKRFLAACEIEGAIEEVDKRDGILDLDTPTSEDDIMPFEFDRSPASFVLGAQALKRAIFYGKIANLEILLKRGVRADDEIQVMTNDWTTTEPEKFRRLQELLSDERSPRVAVCDQTFAEPQLLWRRGQGLALNTDP